MVLSHAKTIVDRMYPFGDQSPLATEIRQSPGGRAGAGDLRLREAPQIAYGQFRSQGRPGHETQHWVVEPGQQALKQPLFASTFGAERVAPAARARAAVSSMSFLRIGTPFVVGTADASLLLQCPAVSERRQTAERRISSRPAQPR